MTAPLLPNGEGGREAPDEGQPPPSIHPPSALPLLVTPSVLKPLFFSTGQRPPAGLRTIVGAVTCAIAFGGDDA